LVDDKIKVIEEINNTYKTTNINICSYIINDEKILLFIEDNKPYKWMIIKDELWISGYGGAMNFKITQIY
jgi:hypothetical protein